MIIGNRRQDFDEPLIFDDKLRKNADPTSTILGDVIIKDLGEITQKYTDQVVAKANAYADEQIKGDFESDEDLLDRAKSSLDEIYGSKREELADKTKKSLVEYGESKSGYASEREKDRAALKARYASAWEDQKDDIARKGLSHSSIADLQGERLTSDYRAASRELDASYDRRVQAIDEKIEKLNRAYEDAMRGYEISYAIELEDKVKKLKSQRDKLADKYYKERQTERDAIYEKALLRETSDDQVYEKTYGDYREDKKANVQERYDYLVNALKGKNSTAVAKFLKDYQSDLKHYLGLYYDRFVEEVS